jgi:hypothetical protein
MKIIIDGFNYSSQKESWQERLSKTDVNVFFGHDPLSLQYGISTNNYL